MSKVTVIQTSAPTAPPTMVAPTQQVMTPNATAAVAQMKGAYIKQVKNFVEAACGWEVANQYEIYPIDPNTSNLDGPHLLHAKERDGDCCYRQCCGPCRANVTDIYLASDPNQVLATYEKTQGLAFNPCCCKSISTLSTFTAGIQGQYTYDDPSLWCPGCTGLGFDVSNYHIYGKGGCHCAQAPCFQYVFSTHNLPLLPLSPFGE